jgi:hypothetical protein
MLPVTQMPTKNESLVWPPGGNGAGYPKWHKTIQWSRQKKPYNLALPYSVEQAWVDRIHSSVLITSPQVMVGNWSLPDNEAKDKAWKKFVANVHASAEIGETLAQGHQAIRMIATRASQLAKFAYHLNRFDFPRARAALRISKTDPRTDRWSKDRTAANMFLEAHFGWSPLVSDIYSAAEVLSSDFGMKRATGRGVSPIVTERNNYPPGPWSAATIWSRQSRVTYGAKVRIENPNLALATSLGLVNPVQLAWQLVPYSHIGDWFFNMSTFLGAWTDLLGFAIEEPYTTVYRVAVHQQLWNWPDFPRSGTGQGYTVTRTLGLQRPELFVRAPKRLSVTRAAVAVSMLIQQLPRRPADLATPSLAKRPIFTFDEYNDSIGSSSRNKRLGPRR